MNLKCECYIHSLKQGEKNVLGEATILKRLGGQRLPGRGGRRKMPRDLQPLCRTVFCG